MAKDKEKSKKDKGAEKSKAEELKKKDKGSEKSKDKPAKKDKPAGEFTQKKFSGSIALTKLVHVLTERTNKKGKKIKGLFIPIKENHLVEGKEGAVYIAVNIVTKSPQDDYGQNG